MNNEQIVSLVAFYNYKPFELINLIQQIQHLLSKQLQEGFYPYPIEQIHATIIGYEGIKTDRGILNRWFWQHRYEEKYINLSASINYIRNTKHLPLRICFGGYQPQIDYGFSSQRQSLFKRSFQVLNTIALLIGWPVEDAKVLLNIHQLRLDFQQFNLLHKYHPKANSIDNDFYLRLGVLTVQPSDEKLGVIETEIRNFLKESRPTHVWIDLDSLSFVGYQDRSLPLITTQVVPLRKANLAQVELLYS